jgi:Ca2+-binding EF-hand superfamily protein
MTLATGGLHKKGVTGSSFTTNFGEGQDRVQNALFSGTKTNILDEERRLIEKVFSIVDRDNSGTIDTKELEEMFRLFGIDTHFLSTAVNRIMANVDKDHDGQISPQEFYKLLSQKFEKGDSRSEIENVFHRMDKKRDNALDADELLEVAQMLGENMVKKDVEEMIVNFKMLAAEAKAKGSGVGTKNLPKGKMDFKDLRLDTQEFYEVMQVEL